MIYTHAYLAALARRMVETDATAEEIAYAVEKPWKHHDELSPDGFAAQPAATDRDAVLRALVSDWQANSASRSLGDPTAATWHQAARQLLDALAARPAPDTLADRVQALAEFAAGVIAEVDRVRLLHEKRGGGRRLVACTVLDRLATTHDVRALLAGRSDASPEGGEQRG